SMSYPRSRFALFAPQYRLVYTAGANGTISGTATQTVYHGCDGAAVTAVPATGYHFTQWSDAATANPRQDLSVTGDVAVAATFALSLTPPDVPVGVTASAGTHLNKIRVAWSAAARANTYAVWRGLRADGADMVKLTDTADTSYDDAAVSAGINYYYWIRAANAAGDSDYSLSANGFPGVVGPMVTANGLVGDGVRLHTGAPLTVAVQLNPGDYSGVPVDWWVAALEQDTGRWYYLNSAMQWTEFDGQLPNCRPVHMGGLFALPSTAVAHGLYLGRGTYSIWFAVDYPMDGILDLSGQYLLSRVTVTVE
ncbi:MAG: hypothetical protein LC725_04675, partial [Lentisphaerae bacterium]|nr:hypothetical protein [Lentisphaerota bacterium]